MHSQLFVVLLYPPVMRSLMFCARIPSFSHFLAFHSTLKHSLKRTIGPFNQLFISFVFSKSRVTRYSCGHTLGLYQLRSSQDLHTTASISSILQMPHASCSPHRIFACLSHPSHDWSHSTHAVTPAAFTSFASAKAFMLYPDSAQCCLTSNHTVCISFF